LRKLMLFIGVLALALVCVAPAAFGQDQPVQAKISDDVQSSALKGKADAKAGGSESKAEPCPVGSDAKSGDIEAKAPCPPKMPPPPPAAAAPMPPPPGAAPPPPPAAPKELPKTGGSGSASLLGLGAGALLIGGGLIARRFLR
jgi:DNA polymerase III subunit gamma/tau